jgi:PhnB protein
MSLNPRLGLLFDGRCEAAFRFYEQRLNGKIEFLMRWSESPMANDAPADWGAKILHGRLVIGDAELLGGHALPGTYQPPSGFSILISPMRSIWH